MSETAGDKAELIRQITAQNAAIEGLRAEARKLRSRGSGSHDQVEARIQELEAKLLRCRLIPVDHDISLEAQMKQQKVSDEHLRQEFSRQQALEITEYPPNYGTDEEDEEEEKRKEQEELVEKQMKYGMQPVPYPMQEYMKAKVVDVRVHNVPAEMMERYFEDKHERQELPERKDPYMYPQRPPPPILQGRIIDSNALLTPSPYHVMGPTTLAGFNNNVYPITRPPVPVEDVLETSWAGAHEPTYRAYADFYQSRAFPPGYCERVYEVMPHQGSSSEHFWKMMAGVDDHEKRGVYGEHRWFTSPPPPEPWMLPYWRIDPLERRVVNTCAAFFHY